ncbi:MAG TPA: hypothetical protein VME40_02720 [Caulobacteraceae bacterium]|nr:hypothetical protein [Caulobacteraceae bacterium]
MVAASTMAAARRDDARSAAAESRLRLLIASGGDDRIWPDPVTRRNRYGVPSAPAPDELWFSSSTACAVSPRGWAAAGEALESVTEGGACVGAWFDSLRSRLKAICGAPGAEVVLSASGTEAELVALHLSLALAPGPIVNIVVAPAETGSGVPAAAAGRHFLARASLSGGAVPKGERLPGWADADIALATVEIRRPCGAPRPQGDIDAEAIAKADAAVARGAFALLHVLDASKTGRAGVSRAAARDVARRYPGRALVLVDACQLRCPPEAIRDDLEAGLAVMITGSKFAGGPAFCGALLLPAAVVERIAGVCADATPLGPYSALLDWPAALRRRFGRGLAHAANLGLGLRWTAALAEIEAYVALPTATRTALLAAFSRAVRGRVAADPALRLLDPDLADRGLAPIVHADGSEPRGVYAALQRGDAGVPPCHLGQPVAVGPRTALRVCASMGMIVEAANTGFARLEADLDQVFAAWARLRA